MICPNIDGSIFWVFKLLRNVFHNFFLCVHNLSFGVLLDLFDLLRDFLVNTVWVWGIISYELLYAAKPTTPLPAVCRPIAVCGQMPPKQCQILGLSQGCLVEFLLTQVAAAA